MISRSSLRSAHFSMVVVYQKSNTLVGASSLYLIPSDLKLQREAVAGGALDERGAGGGLMGIVRGASLYSFLTLGELER